MSFFQNLSSREKILLFSLGLLLILFLGIQLLLRPAAAALAADGEALQNALVSAQQVTMQEQTVSGTRQTMQKTLREATKAASFLFPSLDKPALQVFIENIAKKSGFKVQAITISDPAAAAVQNSAATASSPGSTLYNMKGYADSYTGKPVSSAAASSTVVSAAASSAATSSGTTGDVLALSVNMQMSGSFDNAKKFVDAIKNTNKAVVVTAFSFAKADKGNSCTATLQFYAAQKLSNNDHTLDWNQKKPAGKNSLMK